MRLEEQLNRGVMFHRDQWESVQEQEWLKLGLVCYLVRWTVLSQTRQIRQKVNRFQRVTIRDRMEDERVRTHRGSEVMQQRWAR